MKLCASSPSVFGSSAIASHGLPLISGIGLPGFLPCGLPHKVFDADKLERAVRLRFVNHDRRLHPVCVRAVSVHTGFSGRDAEQLRVDVMDTHGTQFGR